MYPASVIVNTIANFLTEKANQKKEVKDLLDSLLNKLKILTKDSLDAQYAIKALESNPESKARKALLTEELDRLGILENQEITKLYKQLLEKVAKDIKITFKGYTITQKDIDGSEIVVGSSPNISQSVGKIKE